MADYTLKQLNDAARSDPKGFIKLCEDYYRNQVDSTARELAARRGTGGGAAQAVGGAVGRNPVSIVIPCHRVVGAGGSLTGYAGGIEKKRCLLELEGADLSRLYTPKRGTAR